MCLLSSLATMRALYEKSRWSGKRADITAPLTLHPGPARCISIGSTAIWFLTLRRDFNRRASTDRRKSSMEVRFVGQDSRWKPAALHELVIYELHVGTFTQEGAFKAIAARFDHLKGVGVNAIELMPIADFAGDRNWGYDGVSIYAPSRAYGNPDDLRTLVNAAHQAGITVILDVVYNHLGPDGNYMGVYSDHYFNASHHTPWGAAFNLDGPDAAPVRNHFAENPALLGEGIPH